MTEPDTKLSSEDLCRWFIAQQHQVVMLHLGKIANPLTGKLDRNLEAARLGIDILGMFEEKTRGNLTAEEKQLLDHTLMLARMNYVEESRKPQSEPEESESAAPEGAAGSGSPSGSGSMPDSEPATGSGDSPGSTGSEDPKRSGGSAGPEDRKESDGSTGSEDQRESDGPAGSEGSAGSEKPPE